MKWIIDNWSLIVVIICAAAIFIVYCNKFAKLPTQEQQKKVKALLLAIVVEAEKQFGSKTGKVKLSWAYSKFLETMPGMASVVTFEMFSQWVDEVLYEMRNMLSANTSLQDYIDGDPEKNPFK